MKVTQMATVLNDVFEEIIGSYVDAEGNPNIFKEDLSNFIDMGRYICDSSDWQNNYDHYVSKLIDRIGYTLIIDKELDDDGIKIESNKYEYGAYLQKIRISDIDFVDNEVWQLQPNQSYEYFDFKPVDMKAQYFSDKTTFGVEWSWVSKVLKESMESLQKLTQLYAAIENRIMKKIRLCTREMKKRLVANVNGMNIALGRQINLIQEYADATGNLIKASNALTNAEFLKFAAMKLKMYKSFMSDPTTILNGQGELNWTPKANFRMLAITDLDAALTAYLYSSTYHEEFVKLDGYATVSNWQGTIPNFPFDIRSAISVHTTGMPAVPFDPSNPNDKVADTDIDFTGIIAVMFDSQAITIWNEEPELNTAPFNPKGKFLNYYYSFDCNYYYDAFENSITFVISDYNPLLTAPDIFDASAVYVTDGHGSFIDLATVLDVTKDGTHEDPTSPYYELHGIVAADDTYAEVIDKTMLYTKTVAP